MGKPVCICFLMGCMVLGVFNDITLRGTKFVMLHGGSPFERRVRVMIEKPNICVGTSVPSRGRLPIGVCFDATIPVCRNRMGEEKGSH